jgi:PAS domain S-box-containing protein
MPHHPRGGVDPLKRSERRTMPDSLRTMPNDIGIEVLEHLLEASLDGILVVDRERKVRYANDAMGDITGVPRTEMLGTDFLEMVAEDARQQMLDYFSTTVAGQPGYRGSVLRRPTGERRDIEYSNMLLVSDDGPLVCAIVRDVTDTRRRERESSALARIAASLTVEQSMQTTIDLLARSIVGTTRAVASAIFLINADDMTLSMVGTSRMGEDSKSSLIAAWPGAATHSAAAEAFHDQRPRIVKDARNHNLANPEYHALHDMIRNVEWDTIAVVPMVYHGKSLGIVNAYFTPVPEPSAAEIAFLSAIADQAAVAVENARLFHDAQETAALEERQRLARELHDSVSQALYGIGLGARTARTLLDRDPEQAEEPLDYVLTLAEAGLSEMRSLIFELRPESLERESLTDALERQITAIQARHGLQVSADYPPGMVCEPPYAVKEALYRIAQESLHNTVKHARATHASIALNCDHITARLTVRDNGIGFDTSASFPGHFGMRSMRERVERLGGTLSIESSSGHGTTVAASIPLG